jgi:RES domain-containing protein
VKAFRIADRRFPLMDGRGAALRGGRWNSPGRAVVYAAETLSGARLEALVHASIGELPPTLVYVEIGIPAGVAIEEIRENDLPGWDAPDLIASRRAGDAWLARGKSAVLLVPSRAAYDERNVLIDPAHPDFKRLAISKPRALRWDKRLFLA